MVKIAQEKIFSNKKSTLKKYQNPVKGKPESKKPLVQSKYIVCVNNMEKILNDGYAVITDTLFTRDIVKYREELIEESKEFPEFNEGVEKFVLGGFAHLANPSSFHNPVVRNMREWAMSIVIPELFTGLIRQKHDAETWKFEQIIDRMMIRVPGEKPSSESWHRDVSPLSFEGDDIFGGWVNLDLEPQYFSCVPGTHNTSSGIGSSGSGFVPIDKKNVNVMNKIKSEKKMVCIPPGGILVFYENLVHEVLSKESKRTQVRLALGWRLTQQINPLIPGLYKRLQSQAVMPLKSNQIPPMFAALHWTNWVDKIIDWSKLAVVDECLELKNFQNIKAKRSEDFLVVHREMKSLEEYGFRMYEEYDMYEKRILRPNRVWFIKPPGVKCVNSRVLVEI